MRLVAALGVDCPQPTSWCAWATQVLRVSYCTNAKTSGKLGTGRCLLPHTPTTHAQKTTPAVVPGQLQQQCLHTAHQRSTCTRRAPLALPPWLTPLPPAAAVACVQALMPGAQSTWAAWASPSTAVASSLT
jgi:hypothetical protein